MVGIKKQQAVNKIDILKGLDQLQKAIATQNNRIAKEAAEVTRLLQRKKRIMGLRDDHV